MHILFHIFKIFILICGSFFLTKLNAQVDINSKEYVEWVGTCETEVVEKAQLDEKEYNFLYSDETQCFFMDPVDFEQISLEKKIIGEKINLLKENLKVNISFLDDKPLSIELPNNIECIVKSTEGVVKGQTAASSYKPAKLENEIDIMVPPFIEEGDKIILDTRNLEYVKKIN